MYHNLERAVLALAQPADVQLLLFPDFVCKADELALEFDDALFDLESSENTITPEQRATVDALDKILAEMSGSQNAAFWTDDALRSHQTWEVIRSAARDVIGAFGWELRHPPPSGAIYIIGGR
jgi:hypothetical protein